MFRTIAWGNLMPALPDFLRSSTLLCTALSLAFAGDGQVQAATWLPVPEVAWSSLEPSQFSDAELFAPYFLAHFATVANSVVEQGPDRGFIGAWVARRAEDHRPYNARIMETLGWFTTFYCLDRAWNPYRGLPAVRQRLEAMLDFWCRSQSPAGTFAEYKPQGWNLAATCFGAEFMSHTLDLLSLPGAPAIDRTLLERVFVAQRKAIMALLTDPELKQQATICHNQHTGTYRAVVRYLHLRPDPEIAGLLDGLLPWLAANTQSPAGYFYEFKGPDFGYSTVHEDNLTNFEAVFSQASPAVQAKLVHEYDRYAGWLAYNLVLEPDRSGFMLNAAVQNRTTTAFQEFKVRPFAGKVPAIRPFVLAQEELLERTVKKRAELVAQWPKQPPLGKYSVRSAITLVTGDGNTLPTRSERDAAIATLPYLAHDTFTHLRYDARPFGALYVRRPSYYFIANFGVAENTYHSRAVNGPGLLWHPQMGTVIQNLPSSVESGALWGVRTAGQELVSEAQTIAPTLTIAGQAIMFSPGMHDLGAGPVVLAWSWGNQATKQVTAESDQVTVTITAKGTAVEQIPLVVRTGDKIEADGDSVRLSRGGWQFIVTSTGATTKLGAARLVEAIQRRTIELSAAGEFTYRMRFASVP
jgi:hypothetical protein